MVQYWLTRLGVEANSNLMLLVCLTACVMTAWLLNLTIEKPFMRMRDRVIGQNRKSAATKMKPELETIIN